MSETRYKPSAWSRRHNVGVSLIELMVALTIGLVLMLGAVIVYVKAKDTYAATDTTSRMQETARYALGIIESDARMAGYLGLMSRPELLTNLNQSIAKPDGTAVVMPVCDANNWASNLTRYAFGSDNTYGLSCAASGGGARAGSDVLVVRRASSQRVAQSSAGLKTLAGEAVIITSRSAGLVFVGDANGTVPSGYAQTDPVDAPPLADTRRLLVHAYYVSVNSSEGVGFPALRRKTLGTQGGVPTVRDEEVVPGVEDLQVQYGVDTNGDRNADRWVNANDVGATDIVIGVKLWLRVRARERDVAFNDTATYTYANNGGATIPSADQQFRRILMSRTVQVRNARAL
jgi:type IV pilus assembly protein PilW